jgi:hypothetical protein
MIYQDALVSEGANYMPSLALINQEDLLHNDKKHDNKKTLICLTSFKFF